jgi:hypothetical protein
MRAKPRKHKKTKDYSKGIMTCLSVLTFIFGTLTGHLWSKKQADINQQNYDLQIITKRIEMGEKYKEILLEF